ncbi:hypothetical protein C8Q76DRAFT_607455, partial [Earliella scabrosa]
IVWWRAWVVWKGNRGVRAVCVVCLLATAGTSYDANPVGPLFKGDIYGVVALVLSLVNNVIATSLVGLVAWNHRALIREHLKFRSRPSQVERVLSLLVESGVGYCIVWVRDAQCVAIRLLDLTPLRAPRFW